MADDIDDLLSDIEKRINLSEARKWDHSQGDAKVQHPHNDRSGFASRPLPSVSKDSLVANDLNDILSDSWDADDGTDLNLSSPRKKEVTPHTSTIKPSASTVATKKCFPVYVGGSNSVSGLSTTVNKRCTQDVSSKNFCWTAVYGDLASPNVSDAYQFFIDDEFDRACDRLRCTDCDFAVSSFDNVQWSAATDYLFLRNNMPDFERLRTNLVPKKGHRAYACQCKWLTASELMDLHAQTKIKWVCGKH